MQSIRDVVYIDLFTLDNRALQFVLENCAKVKKLILRACEIKITNGFSIKMNIRYTIEELNLFGTCDAKDEEYMNEKKLKIFAAALSNTSLRESLGIIRVCESLYPPDQVQDIFNYHRFDLEVMGDKSLPRKIE